MTAVPIPPPFIEQPYQRVGVEPALPEPMDDMETPEPAPVVVVEPRAPKPAPAPTPAPEPEPAVKPMRGGDRLRLRAIAARRYEGWTGLSEDQKQQIIRRMWAAGE